jgi:hypothetical protein
VIQLEAPTPERKLNTDHLFKLSPDLALFGINRHRLLLPVFQL